MDQLRFPGGEYEKGSPTFEMLQLARQRTCADVEVSRCQLKLQSGGPSSLGCRRAEEGTEKHLAAVSLVVENSKRACDYFAREMDCCNST